jgi:Tetratricopeptide repeat
LGLIQDFQVGSFREALASVPAEPTEIPSMPADEEVSAEVFAEAELEDANEPDPTFATRTIAELYLRQGLTAKARRVLRKILQEDPSHEWARETLQDLGSDGIVPLAQKPPSDSRRAALAARARLLERMLAQVRLRRAPGA